MSFCRAEISGDWHRVLRTTGEGVQLLSFVAPFLRFSFHVSTFAPQDVLATWLDQRSLAFWTAILPSEIKVGCPYCT